MTEYQGAPLRGGDIWLIWKDEKEPGTERFHAEGTACTKAQRLRGYGWERVQAISGRLEEGKQFPFYSEFAEKRLAEFNTMKATGDGDDIWPQGNS